MDTVLDGVHRLCGSEHRLVITSESEVGTTEVDSGASSSPRSLSAAVPPALLGLPERNQKTDVDRSRTNSQGAMDADAEGF